MLHQPLGTGQNKTQYQKTTYRHDNLHGGERLGDDLNTGTARTKQTAAEGTVAQQLTDHTDDDQCYGITDALA